MLTPVYLKPSGEVVCFKDNPKEEFTVLEVFGEFLENAEIKVRDISNPNRTLKISGVEKLQRLCRVEIIGYSHEQGENQPIKRYFPITWKP